MGFEIGGGDRLLTPRVTDHDAPETCFQILERSGQTEDGHHFGRHGNVEPILAHKTVGGPAEPDHDFAQRAIVHVQHALVADESRIDIQRIAVMNVIVEHRGEQIVRRAYCVKVTGEMEVDVLHRHHLRIATPGRAAFAPKTGPERGFAQAHDGRFAKTVHGVAQAHRGRRLAFAGWCRTDRRHQDQLAVGTVFQAPNEIERQLGLVMSVGHQMLSRDAILLAN